MTDAISTDAINNEDWCGDAAGEAARSEYVFIGGTKDGQLISIPEGKHRVEFMVRTESHEWLEIYHRTRIAGAHTSFRVFALSLMDGDDIISELLRVYARSRQP